MLTRPRMLANLKGVPAPLLWPPPWNKLCFSTNCLHSSHFLLPAQHLKNASCKSKPPPLPWVHQLCFSNLLLRFPYRSPDPV